MADKRAYCLGVDARATRGPAGATVKRCACEVAQYMLFGRANAPAKGTEASVYAFNCQESNNDLHTDDPELGLNVVKLLRMEKTGAPGIIKTCSTDEWPRHDDDCAGVVDCVGSQTLANALAQTRYDGTVAACGLAQGPDLPGTVMPSPRSSPISLADCVPPRFLVSSPLRMLMQSSKALHLP